MVPETCPQPMSCPDVISITNTPPQRSDFTSLVKLTGLFKKDMTRRGCGFSLPTL